MKFLLFLLAIFAIVQYEAVKGYPHYNGTEKDLRTISETPFIKKSSEDFEPCSPNLPLCEHLNQVYNDTRSYIAKKMNLNASDEDFKKFLDAILGTKIYEKVTISNKKTNM